ncbi:hypothetical protein MKX03_030428 [Papaver bracteatum]|nr:hypothetical protein MKX03_030428 [Papaver bracteatum]
MGMSGGYDLLDIQPTELRFLFELKKQNSCSLRLSNTTDEYVAFKFKTTNPKKYCVRPNIGMVLPGTTCEVSITMQAQGEAPPDMQCKDKFLVQSVVTAPTTAGDDITPEMFNTESGKVVEEFKLRVIYVPSSPLPVVPQQANLLKIQQGYVLDIQPTELKFPFELKKKCSCSMKLTNQTDAPVAFKVKTTNPKEYCVRPNVGMVFPGTTCDVTVTMQARSEAPQDMQCKDKFLVQMVSAREIFKKESGNKVVEELKLRVIYDLPANPPPVPEKGSCSTPWASCVENVRQEETSVFAAVARTASSVVNGSQEETSVFDAVETRASCLENGIQEVPTPFNAIATRYRLNIEPGELKFPFELKKQSSSSLKLTNKTDEYVYFMVKTTNPKKYCVRPNKGIVLPGTTCDVIVTMKAPQDEDMLQCKDKFLIQSIVTAQTTGKDDIMREMFNQESGKVVEESKLKVIYVPAANPQVVPEPGSTPNPSASCVENENRRTSWFDAVARIFLYRGDSRKNILCGKPSKSSLKEPLLLKH